jgi:hypothetical protein
MALQPYADPGQTLALYQAEQITPEEQERRKQEVRNLKLISCKTKCPVVIEGWRASFPPIRICLCQLPIITALII